MTLAVGGTLKPKVPLSMPLAVGGALNQPRGPAGLEKEGEITSPSKKVREKFWDLGRSD